MAVWGLSRIARLARILISILLLLHVGDGRRTPTSAARNARLATRMAKVDAIRVCAVHFRIVSLYRLALERVEPQTGLATAQPRSCSPKLFQQNDCSLEEGTPAQSAHSPHTVVPSAVACSNQAPVRYHTKYWRQATAPLLLPVREAANQPDGACHAAGPTLLSPLSITTPPARSQDTLPPCPNQIGRPTGCF